MPRADYLAAITLIGVDVLYIITGRRTVHRPHPFSGSVHKGSMTEH